MTNGNCNSENLQLETRHGCCSSPQAPGPQSGLNCWSQAYFPAVRSPPVSHKSKPQPPQDQGEEDIPRKKEIFKIDFHPQRRQTFSSLAYLLPNFSISEEDRYFTIMNQRPFKSFSNSLYSRGSKPPTQEK